MAGDGGDLESQAARDAMCVVLDHVFVDADMWDELADAADTAVSRENLVSLLEMFLAQYVYNRVPVVAEALSRITDPQAARRADENMRQIIQDLVSLRLPEDPFTVDWSGPQGQEIAEDAVRIAYETPPEFGRRPAMTIYLVRTDLSTPVTEPDDVRLLDWAPARTAATIQTGDAGVEFFTGWRAPRAAADLMMLGAATYCADKVTLRGDTPDWWTRDITVRLPVADTTAWREANFGEVLGFLTGDHWQINPYKAARHPVAGLPGVPRNVQPVGLDIDGVCLFSGGLDSLCGVIDLLEEDPQRRLCLLSHNEGGKASTAQQDLFSELGAHYGHGRITRRPLYLRPAPANGYQTRPLPHPRENTTRSRSLLFLTTALALAAAHGPTVPVYVPENGFIGINVPLTRARVGSASTRTTHPHFMAQLGAAARTVGVDNPILNPYRLQTKGEMLAGSRNPELLKRLTPMSISCSHPETARFQRRLQGNCGYCFPCLIRRASLAHVGWDDNEYPWNVLTDEALLRKRRWRRGADLRAVITGAFAERPDRDVLLNGPLPLGERSAFTDVWRRGTQELRDWLVAGAQGELATLVDSLA
ncbi:Qat anti-phage system QueC-like protein QatC [Kibdelosporangium philippinense]|uniref:Qat anti-phage system QueC-like protein QatC n=1 Tax=Kibdelosporangium philippinense TaxID=211113 RepID=UPI0035ED891B